MWPEACEHKRFITKDYPWRCLKRGFFLLMMYNLPLRRTILQSALRFLMEALTFIVMLV